MNKRRLAVFVEGQTELVFVREFLKQWYFYDIEHIGFDCYNLHANQFCDAEYNYGNDDSENYFMIVNVGNDNSVLTNILSRVQYLKNKNYQLVIGLRDMYTKQYIADAGGHRIDSHVSKWHEESVRSTLSAHPNGDFVNFHFAIMEIEAWLLGMYGFLCQVDNRLTQKYIMDGIGLDLDKDPEETIFHPALELGKVYSLVGRKYDKHLSDISSIMANLSRDDYMGLIHSGKCSSFKTFAESLVGYKLS